MLTKQFIFILLVLIPFWIFPGEVTSQSINHNFDTGYQLFRNGKYNDACKYFNKAKDQYLSKPDYIKVTECLYYLALSSYRDKQPIASTQYINELQKISKLNKIYSNLILEGSYLRGVILIKDNKIEEAYNFFNLLLTEINRQEFQDSTRAKIYHEKGTVDYFKGDYFSAISSFEKSVNIGRKAFGGNSLFVSDQINNLGVMNYMLARYDEALKYYKESEKLLDIRKTEDRKGLAGTYTNIGLIFKDKNDIPNALIFFEKARDIYSMEETKEYTHLANIYLNLAVGYSRVNNKVKQFENIEKATYYSEKYNPYIIPKVYFQEAAYYESVKNLSKARFYFERAIIKASALFGESPDLAFAHNNIGNFFVKNNYNVQAALHHFTIARDFFIKTVGFNHIHTTSSYVHLGDYYLQTGSLHKALGNYHTALLSVTENFTNSDIYSYPETINPNSLSLSIDILKAKATVLEKLYSQTSDKNLKIKYLNSSFFHYKQAIQQIRYQHHNYFNEESRLLLSENENKTHSDAIRTAFELYQLTGNNFYRDNAFLISNNAHAASLQSTLLQKESFNPTSKNPPLLKKEAELKSQLALYNEWINTEKKRIKPNKERLEFWNNKIAETTFQIEEVMQKINTEHPAYRHFSSKLISIQTVQNKLQHNECLIEYYLADSVLFSYFVTHNQLDIHKIPIGSNFYENINDILQFIKYPTFTMGDTISCLLYRDAAHELYKLLIQPYEKSIKNKSLIIVPYGELTYLPFCTLLTENTKNINLNFKELPYLIKKNPIRYLYASGLLNISDNTAAPKHLLAMAPGYTGESSQYAYENNRANILTSLYYNQKEVQTIVKYTGGKSLLSEEASEELFKKNAHKYRILHLAMHANANDEDPQQSGLFFTPNASKNDDDILYSYETYNLKLNADLMVLSACNSGSGKLRKGEGIISLTRGFVFAGVKSMVMSLWTVNDKTAYLINEKFYKNITGKMPKDEALQHSKLEYISTSDIIHAHPYYWANYVLIGDNTPIYISKSRNYYFLLIAGILIVLVSIYFARKKKIIKI